MGFRPPPISDFDEGKRKIAVIGLGYVGINVAVHFAKHWRVVGYDIDPERIKELSEGRDRTGETSREQLENPNLSFTSDPNEIADCSVFIVCVPTPVDEFKNPDIRAVKSATQTVGKLLKKGDVFILESTVWPGFTEEVCIPILEKTSGLKAGRDFSVAYSPERVNPGDKEHTFDKVVKVVGALDDETADFVCELYARVVKAGVFKVSSIKEAEAAKIIENAQRDINIAFMNEIAMLFDKLGINTKNVLKAASTKWNFLRFEPGLVGGHCQTPNSLVVARVRDKTLVCKISELPEIFNCRKMELPDADLWLVRDGKLLSFNPEAGFTFQNVRFISRRRSGKILKLKLSSGLELNVTDMHPLVVFEDGKYRVKFARDVREGEFLPCFPLKHKGFLQRSGEPFAFQKVEKVETREGEFEVWSVEVPETKNYITDAGVCTHNCIPVDPYYLAHKARQIGFHPQIILAGRRVNDGMGVWLAQKIVKRLVAIGKQVRGCKILVMGITFKENVPDFRNSRVFDLVEELESFHTSVFCFDPYASSDNPELSNLKVLKKPDEKAPYDAIVVAVRHKEFLELTPEFFASLSRMPAVFVDVKGVWDENDFKNLGFDYISL